MYYKLIDKMLNTLDISRNDLDIRFIIDGRRRVVRGFTPIWLVWQVIFTAMTVGTLWSILILSIMILG